MVLHSPRLSLDVHFRDTMEDTFIVRLKGFLECLAPRGQTQLSYHDLMLRMFDIMERQATQPITAADTTNGK